MKHWFTDQTSLPSLLAKPQEQTHTDFFVFSSFHCFPILRHILCTLLRGKLYTFIPFSSPITHCNFSNSIFSCKIYSCLSLSNILIPSTLGPKETYFLFHIFLSAVYFRFIFIQYSINWFLVRKISVVNSSDNIHIWKNYVYLCVVICCWNNWI